MKYLDELELTGASVIMFESYRYLLKMKRISDVVEDILTETIQEMYKTADSDMFKQDKEDVLIEQAGYIYSSITVGAS